MVPDSELVVTREAFANNSSKYVLNGKTSTFTDVTDVFKAKGVDLDNNRFLILQARAGLPWVVPAVSPPFENGAALVGLLARAPSPVCWADLRTGRWQQASLLCARTGQLTHSFSVHRARSSR